MSKQPTKAQLQAELAQTKAALARQTKAADNFAHRVVELNKQIKDGAK